MKLESTIELLSNDQPLIRLEQIELFDDGSGAKGLLTINSGHFSCSGYPFYFDEFIPFCRQIPEMYKTLKGKTELRLRYERDVIELEMDKLGHVIVRGLIDSGSDQQQLKFHFVTDQTCLSSLVASVEAVVAELEEANKTLHPIRSKLRSLLKGEC
ncbi:MAG: hypothetical protein C0404_10310 [Verrucomicrobia bacterium]|nr:hypothetical protein [Verrucomicrobiota bacterium]